MMDFVMGILCAVALGLVPSIIFRGHRWLALVIVGVLALVVGCEGLANAQDTQVSIERQAAMVPWVARDREQAMNDRALCSADLLVANNQVAALKAAPAQLDVLRTENDDLKRQIDVLKKQIAELSASKPSDAPTPD